MPVIDYIDPTNRLIYLSASTTSGNLTPMDIYTEVRTLRRLSQTLRAYPMFIAGGGNISKGGGKFTERYVSLLEGTRIVPFDTSHILTITGTLIDDAGNEGAAVINKAPLSISTRVDIVYVPPQVEIIVIDGSGSSSLTSEQSNKLDDISSSISSLTNNMSQHSVQDIVAAMVLVAETFKVDLSALNTAVGNIPTNPLVSTDPRIDTISSDAQAAKLSAQTVDGKLAPSRLERIDGTFQTKDYIPG